MSQTDLPQTHEQGSASAPLAAAVSIAPTSPAGAARQRKGRRKGGSNGRAVALIGLGAPLPTVELRTTAQRMAVLEATLQAAAEGRTSGLLAQVLISVVREARAEAQDHLERLAQAQAQEIERLRGAVRA